MHQETQCIIRSKYQGNVPHTFCVLSLDLTNEIFASPITNYKSSYLFTFDTFWRPIFIFQFQSSCFRGTELVSIKHEDFGPTTNLDEIVTRTISVASGSVTETYWSEPYDWLLCKLLFIKKNCKVCTFTIKHIKPFMLGISCYTFRQQGAIFREFNYKK